MKVCALLVLCVLAVSAKRKSYEGYKVLEVTPKSPKHISLLREQVKDNEVDFWKLPGKVGQKIHVMLPPHKFLTYVAQYLKQGIPFQIFRSNVETVVAAEYGRLQARLQDPSTQAFNIDDFNTYDDTMKWMDTTASSCSGGLTCQTYNIGKSYEGRDIKVFKLSSGGDNKPAYYIDSDIHAREWLAPATNLKILNHMVTKYSSDAQVKTLVDTYDWYFMIIVNPDGYVFSWETERYWRKNRKPNQGTGCYGTDLNRNFDTKWMADGSSDDPCSDIYAGSSAASEVETQLVQDEYKRLGSKVKAVVSIHSAAYMWLHQYGYSVDGTVCKRADDHDDLNRVADAAASATESATNDQNLWQRGSICETIYPASGGTIDYTKDTAGIKYGFGIELRGPDFVTVPSEIEESFKEIWAGLVAMVNAIN